MTLRVQACRKNVPRRASYARLRKQRKDLPSGCLSPSGSIFQRALPEVYFCSMYLLRPVEARDLKSLLRLAASAGVGLTTLPNDQAVLKTRIDDSLRGFARMAEKPGGETYLF